MPGKVYYNQEHSINDFLTQERERTFLANLLAKATGNKRRANTLTQQWRPDTRLKFSYVVRLIGVNAQGQQTDCASFSIVGVKPREIIEILKQTGLKPGEQVTLVETPGQYSRGITTGDIKAAHHNIGSTQLQSGTYRLIDARVSVKFYNNPQQSL